VKKSTFSGKSTSLPPLKCRRHKANCAHLWPSVIRTAESGDDRKRIAIDAVRKLTASYGPINQLNDVMAQLH
jgi:hypothetical protein